MKIGVFDSGIGGLTVMKSLLESKYFEEIIYYGDTARVPYGIKDRNTIIRYSLDALEFFKNFEIDMVITACNSVSAYAINELRNEANFKVYGVIESGVLALENRVKNNKNVLIIATKATIKSQKYQNFLNQKGFNNIISKPTSLFIPIVEEGIFEGEVLNSAMDYYFKDVNNIDAVILGCTHFPLISNPIQNYFGKDTVLIHSGEAILEFLEKNENLSKKFDKTEVKFFATENPDGLKEVAKNWLGL
jgi:glutamate racemase